MLNKSKSINEGYAAKIARIDAIEAIPDADRIVNAVCGVEKTVVSKDMKVGDIVVMFPCETVISQKYLSYHNLYERSHFELNSNHEETLALMNRLDPSKDCTELEEKIRSNCGLFSKSGRVVCKKLRGVYSLYYIAPVKTLVDVWPGLSNINWEDMEGTIFDSIGDEVICRKYVPAIRERKQPEMPPQPWYKRSMRKLKRFDRLVPGQFQFHYDTGKLVDNIHLLQPYNLVDITVKVHGTSVILGNILVNKKLNIFQKLWNKLGGHISTTEYGNIYSSRKVIRNRYINLSKGPEYYSVDAYGACNRDFAEFIEPGMTVYGEICGYLEGSDKFIQKKHDYGCNPGEWKFMPYRITTTKPNGKIIEWEIADVKDWVNSVKMILHDNGDPREDRLMELNTVYSGCVGRMYDNLWEKVRESTSNEEYEEAVVQFRSSRGEEYNEQCLPKNLTSYREYVLHKWRIALLYRMQNDKTMLGMEIREPMCKNKVPREGVVIRISGSEKSFALKLKSNAHYLFEKNVIDSGEIDIEEEN